MMPDPVITWWVTFEPDYPTIDGPMHVYCANADIENEPVGARFEAIKSTLHSPDNCFIDHESRLADIEIPDEIKTNLNLQYWIYKKFNP